MMSQRAETSLPQTESIPIDNPERLTLYASNPIGEPLTWGPTPFLSTPDVYDQHRFIANEFETLFDGDAIPNYVPDHIVDYIHAVNMARTTQRQMRNKDSWQYRGKIDFDDIPLDMIGLVERAGHGFASPAELLYLQKRFEIPTFEIASLTHLFGTRIHDQSEHLTPMRSTVDQAVDMHSGYVLDEQERTTQRSYEIKGSDSHHDPSKITGIHMTRKTKVATFDDDSYLIERSSFVVMIDTLGPDVAGKVRSIPYDEFWEKRVAKALNIRETIPKLLDANMFAMAIPVSTTIVSINPELEHQLLNPGSRRQRQLAIARRAFLSSGANIDGMLFVRSSQL